MYRFSTRSQKRLDSCHSDLQLLFNTVLIYRDCTIACGHRPEEDQNRLFATGYSQVRWPLSNHNSLPSNAVDVYPCIEGVVSFDRDQCLVFGGFVCGLAKRMGLNISWGGDWDGDHNLKEHSLQDLGHFELIGE